MAHATIRLALASVLVLGLTTTALCQTKKPKPVLSSGDAAPMFFLYDTAGKMYFLREQCGAARKPKRAIILDFFSTKCAPCKREMPHLVSLYRKHKNKGLSLVIIGFRQKSELLRPYFKKKKFQDIVVLSDLYGLISKKFGVISLPRTVVLDGKCKVRGIFDAKTKGHRKKLARTVTALLP